MVLSRKELGSLVKKARDMKSKSIGKKYTQQMLANDLKLSRGYIGDIENGRTYPNYVLLDQIAHACNVPLSFFDNSSETESTIPDALEPTFYKTPTEAIEFILEQPALMEYGNYDLDELTKDEIISVTNDLLLTLKISLERIRKK